MTDPCPNCAEMQKAVTQTARANRSLEKKLVKAQNALREAANWIDPRTNPLSISALEMSDRLREAAIGKDE